MARLDRPGILQEIINSQENKKLSDVIFQVKRLFRNDLPVAEKAALITPKMAELRELIETWGAAC